MRSAHNPPAPKRAALTFAKRPHRPSGEREERTPSPAARAPPRAAFPIKRQICRTDPQAMRFEFPADLGLAVPVVMSLLSLRLFRLAWRTRRLPELLVGIYFLLVPFAISLSIRVDRFDADHARGRAHPSRTRSSRRAESRCCSSSGAYSGRTRAGRGGSPSAARRRSSPAGRRHPAGPYEASTSLFLLLPVYASYLWVFLESFRYFALLRRRRRLGLADPVITNRFLLFAIWTGGVVAITLLGVAALVRAARERHLPRRRRTRRPGDPRHHPRARLPDRRLDLAHLPGAGALSRLAARRSVRTRELTGPAHASNARRKRPARLVCAPLPGGSSRWTSSSPRRTRLRSRSRALPRSRARARGHGPQPRTALPDRRHARQTRSHAQAVRTRLARHVLAEAVRRRGPPGIYDFLLTESLARYGAPQPGKGVGIVGKTIIRHGNEKMKRFFLPKIIRGEIEFAIGYSEPRPGSDAAASMQGRAATRRAAAGS